ITNDPPGAPPHGIGFGSAGRSRTPVSPAMPFSVRTFEFVVGGTRTTSFVPVGGNAVDTPFGRFVGTISMTPVSVHWKSNGSDSRSSPSMWACRMARPDVAVGSGHLGRWESRADGAGPGRRDRALDVTRQRRKGAKDARACGARLHDSADGRGSGRNRRDIVQAVDR